jgi:hypothetical protein
MPPKLRRNTRTELWPQTPALCGDLASDIESLVEIHAGKRIQPGTITEALERVTRFEAIKAQIAVIYSETWRDRFQQSVELNQQFIDA